MAVPDTLTRAREALEQQDWEATAAALEEARFDGEARFEIERGELLGEALWWLGRVEDAIEVRQATYRVAEEAGELRMAGQLAVWLWENNTQRMRPAIASAWLQRARRALADDPDCREHVALQLREAELAHGEGRLDDALGLAEQGLELARRLRSEDLEAEALQTIGRVLIDRREVAKGIAHLDEAMLLAVEGRLGPYSTGKVYCSLISACEELGDFRRAAEWTEATSQWAQRHPLAIFPGICRIHRAVVLDRRGSLADAEREASRACNELLGSHLANAAAAYAEVGDIRRRLGDLDRAEEAFSRAEELTGRACAGVALVRLAQGRVDEAARAIDGCMAESRPDQLGRARILPAAAQIAIAAGELTVADERVRELEALAEEFDTPVLHALASLARGRVQLADGQAATAVTTLRDALQRWTELEVPYEVATARTVLGQALRETGDEAGAMASFHAARTLFDQIGAHLEATGVGVVVPAPTGPPSSLPRGLTRREVEVLQLIAAGLSNKDIAASLHLSVKTVSRHLSNIFTKIDVSSRAAATAFAFEHQLVGTGGVSTPRPPGP